MSFLQSYAVTQVVVNSMSLCGSPLKPLIEVKEPPSFTASIASSFNKAPSAMPSTPLGNSCLILSA